MSPAGCSMVGLNLDREIGLVGSSALWMRVVLFGRASVAMPVSMRPSQKPIKPSRLGIKESCEPFVRKLKQAPYNPAMQPTQS